jgi:hypothetical protein
MAGVAANVYFNKTNAKISVVIGRRGYFYVCIDKMGGKI